MWSSPGENLRSRGISRPLLAQLRRWNHLLLIKTLEKKKCCREISGKRARHQMPIPHPFREDTEAPSRVLGRSHLLHEELHVMVVCHDIAMEGGADRIADMLIAHGLKLDKTTERLGRRSDPVHAHVGRSHLHC